MGDYYGYSRTASSYQDDEQRRVNYFYFDHACRGIHCVYCTASSR